ncbi:unnamed protein product [Meloidogyne enterolobii]|uniref:Uncharacterized protein n=1 Tax=Meloidogyne enterolobii TaxID=390850 RepID=A0ACB1ABQ3_MELEN
MDKPQVQNVVSTVTLLKEILDLEVISKNIKNSNYNPKKFSALIIKNFEPIRATALLFSNGRLVCVGTKSSSMAKEATIIFVQQIANALKETTIDIDKFKIQNVVASFKFPKTLNLPGNT